MNNRIQELRRKANLTQAQLAEKCGWAKGQGRVSNYETGLREPDLTDCWALVKAFGELGLADGFGDVFPAPAAGEEAA